MNMKSAKVYNIKYTDRLDKSKSHVTSLAMKNDPKRNEQERKSRGDGKMPDTKKLICSTRTLAHTHSRFDFYVRIYNTAHTRYNLIPDISMFNALVLVSNASWNNILTTNGVHCTCTLNVSSASFALNFLFVVNSTFSLSSFWSLTNAANGLIFHAEQSNKRWTSHRLLSFDHFFFQRIFVRFLDFERDAISCR